MPRPSLSPLKVENLICYGCSSEMRHRVEKMANGKPVSMTYYCDNCKYGFQKTMEHASGDMQSPKYIPLEEKVLVEAAKKSTAKG